MERLLYKGVVYSNTVQSLLAIVKAMDELSIEYENGTTCQTGSDFISFVDGMHILSRSLLN